MDESQQTLLGELCQKFIIFNVTLYEYKYGETSEGRRRLKLYNSICKSFLELKHMGISDLSSLFFNVSLTFPMLPLEHMKSLDENLKSFVKTKTLDLSDYTEVMFVISNTLMGTSQQMIRMLNTAHMRTEKHSRLDKLDCKPQVIEIFKKIRLLEQTNHAKGRSSAFATAFQKELKPLLQNTDYFKANVEYDEHARLIIEPDHTVNDRAYKSIKKLYENWKKNSTSKYKKVFELMDKYFWSTSAITPQDSLKLIDVKTVPDFVNFVNNIDEILVAEKKNTTPL